MSSVDFEECCHKILKLNMREGQEMELCNMTIECCMQERTYLSFYGLLAHRFCLINEMHKTKYEETFYKNYATIHRLETNKLRNVAKFYAHLLFSDAISWTVFQCVRLTEDDTTSSSRIFIKIVFQEVKKSINIFNCHVSFQNKWEWKVYITDYKKKAYKNILPGCFQKITSKILDFQLTSLPLLD